ncbi:MAG: hypothetical protein MHPSP_002935, partial [Paramarteilia canceri]
MSGCVSDSLRKSQCIGQMLDNVDVDNGFSDHQDSDEKLADRHGVPKNWVHALRSLRSVILIYNVPNFCVNPCQIAWDYLIQIARMEEMNLKQKQLMQCYTDDIDELKSNNTQKNFKLENMQRKFNEMREKLLVKPTVDDLIKSVSFRCIHFEERKDDLSDEASTASVLQA